MKQLLHISAKQKLIFVILLILCVSSIYFVFHNYALYERPIVKIKHIGSTEQTMETNEFGDRRFTQEITGELMNSRHKGQNVLLTNTYSGAKAYDQQFKTGDEVFITIDKKQEGDNLTGGIRDVKRDKYMMIAFWFFLFALIIAGKRQGLLTVTSLAVNILLLVLAIEIFVETGINLLVVSGILAVLFTVITLLLINGFNEKTYAAAIATLLGTGVSLGITLLAMKLTSENGIYYEEMGFLTRPYKLVFIAGLFIGSLGAVMDVAMTMTSAIFELGEKNRSISVEKLRASGLEIGRDIMGTMTSILFFAYLAGSIPILLLYLKNASPLGFTLSINLSLEIVRALAGGIGIVLAIPIGLYVSIFFVKRKRARL